MAITPRGITMGTNVSFSSYPTQTWMIDPVTKRISGMADGLAAMAQAVDIVLNIRRYHWQIYLPSSGNEVEAIGENFDTARVAIQAQIRDALLQDDRVTDVNTFSFTQSKNAMTVAFTVATVFGNLNAEVVL